MTVAVELSGRLAGHGDVVSALKVDLGEFEDLRVEG